MNPYGQLILTTSSWEHHCFLKPVTAAGYRFAYGRDATETGCTTCPKRSSRGVEAELSFNKTTEVTLLARHASDHRGMLS
jgi:hypothetical protein